MLYRPTLLTTVLFLLLLAAAVWIFFGRTHPALRLPPAMLPPDFYHHASNLCISFVVCATLGYAGLMLGVSPKYLLLLCTAMALVNVVFELWIPVGNVCDPMDAGYGVAGSGIALLLLSLAKRNGMKRKQPIQDH